MTEKLFTGTLNNNQNKKKTKQIIVFQIFSYFTECMKLSIQNAKNEGRYNEGMLDITASSVEMVGKPREIFKDLNRGHTSTRYFV